MQCTQCRCFPKREGLYRVDTSHAESVSASLTDTSLSMIMHTGDSCAYAKMTHKPVPKERSGKHANSPGGEVHTDLWGPCLVKPLGGKQYYISFTDDKNCYMQVYLLTLIVKHLKHTFHSRPG